MADDDQEYKIEWQKIADRVKANWAGLIAAIMTLFAFLIVLRAANIL